VATTRFGAISSARLNNYTATVAPTTTDDTGLGYALGSVWVNTVTRHAYICVDATASAAVWKPLTGAIPFGGGVPGVFGPGLHTVFPICVLDIDPDSGLQSSTTTANIGLLEVITQISVARISIGVSTAGAAGATIRIAIYSYDGTTKLIDVTIAAAAQGEKSTTLAAVVLPPGYYWVLSCRADANGGTSPTIRVYSAVTALPALGVTAALVDVYGFLTITGGNAPAVPVDFTSLSSAATRCPCVRLDNA
jgi:hypothetical protein